MGLDILAFGAHPDDVEIGVGGILAKHCEKGFNVGICNLTRGELSSNGDVEIRKKESIQASKVLGVETLLNLNFPDRGIGDKDQVEEITKVIREYRPKVVLAPYKKDRHPDHVNCSLMVKEATFDAAISKRYISGTPPHKVSNMYYYPINGLITPNLVIDVTEVYHKKTKALKAYKSQFVRSEYCVDTILNSNSYIEMVESRDKLFGFQISTNYGEGLVVPGPILSSTLL